MEFISRQIVKFYKSTAFKRRDDEGNLFYYKPSDFDGLISEKFCFKTSKGHNLIGYFYYYDVNKSDRLIVFEHGMGVGHRAYYREIERLAREGYLVYSYDHTGCTESEGETTMGLSGSLVDLDACIGALINYGYKAENISVVGHSWGGYSTLNILSYYPNLRSIVAMAGFISMPDMLDQVFPKFLSPFKSVIYQLESEVNPGHSEKSALSTLQASMSKALIIHSIDDDSVDFKRHFARMRNELSHKENITFLELSGKMHNPTYTDDAVKYKKDFFKAYSKRMKKGKYKDKIAHRAFLESYDWKRMTEQDEDIWNKIFAFLER